MVGLEVGFWGWGTGLGFWGPDTGLGFWGCVFCLWGLRTEGVGPFGIVGVGALYINLGKNLA